MAPFLYSNSWPAQRMYRCCLGRGTSTCVGEMGRGARPLCPGTETHGLHSARSPTGFRNMSVSFPPSPAKLLPYPMPGCHLCSCAHPRPRQPPEATRHQSHFSVIWLLLSAPAGAAGPRSFPRTSAQCLGPGDGPASHALSVQEVPWTE